MRHDADTTRARPRRRFGRALLAAVLVAGGSAVLAASPADASPIPVHPGESIQAALDAAAPGSTIVVQPGTYAESLLITKTVTLKAGGASLVQPAAPPDTPCNGGGRITGICVVGTVGPPPDFPVLAPVDNVHIVGITIQEFSGDGIFAYGARGMTLEGAVLSHNGGYGLFANTSSSTTVFNNVSRYNVEAGLYFGDSPDANISVHDNVSLGNLGDGIFLRNALGGKIINNTVTGNCIGITVLADAPGPAGNFEIGQNAVSRNNKACPESDDGPPTSGIGIVLIGARNTKVSRNDVSGNKPSGPTIGSGGILVISGFGGTAPSHDTVSNNNVFHNSPNDVFWDGTGSVSFVTNNCGLSDPTSICGGGGTT